MTASTHTDQLDPELAAVVQPLDEHNRQLLQNVHPGDWVNPEPADRYHLVVVGAGTAGLVSAAAGAGLGARVALVERRLMGGDCLNHGCVPSKALLRAARAWHEARRGASAFGAPPAAGEGDFGRVMERMRRLRAGIASHDSARRFRDLGVDLFLGQARFAGSDAVAVGGQRLRFRRAIVATGGRPAAPPIPGLQDAGFLTNETLFGLTRLPQRLGIIGGGPIGCEMAQAFARFGSRVTLFDMAPQVLTREDADAAAIVQESLRRDGVRLELDARLTEVVAAGDRRRVRFAGAQGSAEAEVDELLVATGRQPNTEGLGLEGAGIAFDPGGIQVDDRLRTTNPRVYAVGDVASQYQFTHMADALARVAIQNALFFGRARASELVVPWCTYTSPEVAHVGLYEAQARERGLSVEVLTLPLSEVDRSLLEGSEEGFLRLVLAKGKDRVLGATLVAEHAGDMIGELCLAITHRVGLGKISSAIHPYPTQGEVIKKAADQWRRGRLTPRVQRVLAAWFALFR